MIDDARHEQLWELHDALAKALLHILQDEEPVRASMLSVICQFLRDNGITIANGSSNRTDLQGYLKALNSDLPFSN